MSDKASPEESLLRYTKHVEKRMQDDPEYEPHPIVKALMLAVQGAEEAGIDDNYMGVAGVGTELAYTLVIEKKGEFFEVKETVDLNTGKRISGRAMARMVDAERMLDDYPEDVPVDAAIKVMQEAMPDTEVILLGEDQAEEALAIAKEAIQKQRLAGAPNEATRRVLEASASDWKDLPSETRALVGTLWASGRGKNALAITAIEPTVPKEKVRHTVASAVQWLS